MILTLSENRTKSNKLAEIYLKEVKEKFPNSLKLQCITEDENLWKIENYKEFLKERRGILSDRFNHFLNNISITNTDVKSQIDTHEAVCAERWKETILRIKRIEHIMIGTAGTMILLLLSVILRG